MRRRMNGAVMARSCSNRPVSCSRSMGAAKRVRKVVADPSMFGLQKSMMVRSSPRLFSTGVPVSAMRWRAGSFRTAFDTAVFGFLIACASSRTT